MAPVQLYVYDLSNGMMRNLSFQLTGMQIDGIWHTSVVVFGKEVYYGPYNAGPGIQTTLPGRSHHGRPLKIENVGETEIDEDTFTEYLAELKQQYTGDKYHLLDFNCNSFTNDCVAFLTGNAIPSYIKDLPRDFESTPLGQQLRPMIDNMYRRAAGPAATYPQPATPAVASQAEIATLTSPIHIATNTASFASILRTNKAVIIFFTSDTCGPCKVIAPVFKDVAAAKNREGAAFVEVNMSHGMSGMIAQEHGIRATPTFLFFLSGKKTDELRGVNAIELKSKTDLLLFDAFPPHPHAKMDLPAIRKISPDPILFTQPPPFDNAYKKLGSFINVSSIQDKASASQTLADEVLPFLKSRFPAGKETVKSMPWLPLKLLDSFARTTTILLDQLSPNEVFPAVDFWRIAVLDDRIGTWLGLSGTRPDGMQTDTTQTIFIKVASLQETDAPRNLVLTTIKLACNCFSSPDLTRHILTPTATTSAPTAPRSVLTSLLIAGLLHDEDQTRTSAASLAFNVASYIQRPRMESQRTKGTATTPESDVDADWEIELSSALVEALRKETANEGIVHRLSASLALVIHLSPSYEEHLAPLLEALQVKEMLKGKLAEARQVGYGKEVEALIREVISLCP